jgi:hypothetical protein
MKVLDPRNVGAWATSGLANLLIVVPLAWAIAIKKVSPELHAYSLKEDGALEWMTAWAFLAAGLIFARAAWLGNRNRKRSQWFLVCLAVVCVLVTLEEVSWGQRLLGFRAPVYFLEHNVQQEFNLHNLLPSVALGRRFIVLGYGIALPFLYVPRTTRQVLERLSITPPALALVPGFAFLAIVDLWDPFKFTGELLEPSLSVAFLFSALSILTWASEGSSGLAPSVPRVRELLLAWLAVAALGAVSGYGSVHISRGHPGNVAAAGTEVEALRRDLLDLIEEYGGDPPIDCGSRRIYTWISRQNVTRLDSGRFRSLTSRGLPEERADYFIDPWNLPYRVSRDCSPARERILIYSYGPNRRRETERLELGGDDIGVAIELGRS